nr:hypothetical protein [Bryobacterales bacterium]
MIRPLGYCFPLMLAIAMTIVLPLNTQTKPSSSTIPDDIAYVALFHVVYDAPKPHWDRETCIEWLRERLLTWHQALMVIEAANRYMQIHKEVEQDLEHFHRQTQNL